MIHYITLDLGYDHPWYNDPGIPLREDSEGADAIIVINGVRFEISGIRSYQRPVLGERVLVEYELSTVPGED